MSPAFPSPFGVPLRVDLFKESGGPIGVVGGISPLGVPLSMPSFRVYWLAARILPTVGLMDWENVMRRLLREGIVYLAVSAGRMGDGMPGVPSGGASQPAVRLVAEFPLCALPVPPERLLLAKPERAQVDTGGFVYVNGDGLGKHSHLVTVVLGIEGP